MTNVEFTMKLPTFLGVGMEKCGTTSVYEYLNQHAQVFMSPVKETNFLERDWSDVDRATSKRPPEKSIDTLEKYASLFENAGDARAIGEVSPNYLFHYQQSSQRIQRYLPEVKMFAILRDPVERAFSDYLMHVRDVIDPDKLVSLDAQLERKAHSSFTLRKGLYAEPVAHFYATFGRDRIRIFLYDRLVGDPVGFMGDLYDFIGVDRDFVPDTRVRAQTAEVPKSQAINKLLRTQNPVRSVAAAALRTVLPESTRQTLRSRLLRLNAADKSAVKLAPETRQRLIDFYAEDVRRLQDLIQQDLSGWLKPTA